MWYIHMLKGQNISPRNRRILSFLSFMTFFIFLSIARKLPARKLTTRKLTARKLTVRKLTDHSIILFGSDSFLTRYDLQLIMYGSDNHPLLWFFGVELSFSNHITDILQLIPFQHNLNHPDI